MRCESVGQNFKGLNFRLKPETLEAVSKSTGLSQKELLNESLSNMLVKAKERGVLKKQNTFKSFLSDLYKNFGEKHGLLKKERYFFTDVD